MKNIEFNRTSTEKVGILVEKYIIEQVKISIEKCRESRGFIRRRGKVEVQVEKYRESRDFKSSEKVQIPVEK